MIKRAIGFVLFMSSYALMFVGAALFVINLLLFSSNIAGKTRNDFVTPLLMVGVGYIFRIIGQRLQRIPY